MSATGVCPECDAAVGVSADTEAGEIIACPECGVDLEVLGVDPPRFAVAPPEEEDWGE